MSDSGNSEQLYPEPPERLCTFGIRNSLAFVGPGVIIASVTIGSGELVWASRSGAVFGYQMLWCFLLAGLFKGVQVFTAARHLTLTGEHPMVSWRSIPGPPLWFPLLIALPTLAVMPIAFSSISEILGGYAHELIGGWGSSQTVGPFARTEFWENAWATAILTTCVLLAIGTTMNTLERASAFVLGALVVCAFVSVVVCRPDVWAILGGLLTPIVPDYEAWVLADFGDSFRDRSPWLEVALYLTAVGGGTYDYIGYLGMMREKKWGLAGREVASRERLEAAFDGSEGATEELRRARAWTRAPLLDTSISFACVIVVTILFAALGALVLHAKHQVPDNNTLLSQQEAFLTLLHPHLRWVYRIGVLLAFIGTLYGAFELYRHTVVESVRALAPNLASERHVALLRRLTAAYCFWGGMVLIWLPKSIAGDVVSRMTLGAVIGGATLCGLWCFAMLWIDRANLPRALRMSRPLWCSTFVAGVVMTALGVQTLKVYFFG